MTIEYKDLQETKKFVEKNKVTVVIYKTGEARVNVCLMSESGYMFFLSTQRRNGINKIRCFKTIDAAFNVVKKIPNVSNVELIEKYPAVPT